MNKLSILLVLGFVFPLLAVAETGSASRVAIFDMQKAIMSVAEGKKARESLQKDWEEKQKKLQAESKKIQDSMEDLRKQSMVLDEKTRHEKEEAIQAQILKLRELDAKSQGEFQKRDHEVSEPIIKKLRVLVAKLSKDRDYTLVIDGNENTIIYSQGNNDITDEIIKQYDAKK